MTNGGDVMGEKVIIAVCNMLTPLTMLGLGLMIWKTRPPYGDIFGYRTTQSQKSPEAWELAQALFGKYCTLTYAVLSGLTLIAGVVPIIFRLEPDDLAWTWIVTIVNLVNVIALFIVIGTVDHTVKKTYPDVKKDTEG